MGRASSTDVVPFYGLHQGGVDTPAQEFLHFASFDATSPSVDDLRELLKEWTAAAASLTEGKPYEALAKLPAPL